MRGLLRIGSFITVLVKSLLFWGVLFFLTMVIGLGVPFMEIIDLCMHANNVLCFICIYAAGSCIVFPVMQLIRLIYHKHQGTSFCEQIIQEFKPQMMMPYWGFNVKGLSDNIERRIILRRLLTTLCWWLVAGTFAFAIMTTSDNPILIAIQAMPAKELLTRLGCILGVIVFLTVLSVLLFKLLVRKWRQEDETSYQQRSKKGPCAQQYYDRHPDHIPSACKACGGPYPLCKDSCSVFDDD